MSSAREGRLRGARASTSAGAFRRLAVPQRVKVKAGAGGVPETVDDRAIDAVRESWLIEDRWWTERPIRRHYWEVVTVCGRNEVVFEDLRGGRWWRQR
jgi:hypothetical protein